MAFDGGPPLHKDAITAATERADRIQMNTDEPLKLYEKSPEINRFPTYHLEPFQMQRAQALERAVATLPDAMVEDQIKAAMYIETGHTPDV